MKTKVLNIALSDVTLIGDLSIPDEAKALIIFAHGSGSSRLSPRNRRVADVLNGHHFATLLFDLLTEMEDCDYAMRFDIQLLTRRLIDTTERMLEKKELEGYPIGYFGASTGAAAALAASAALPSVIKAVVSRGGRPDLAKESLKEVRAATLLIVGGSDEIVIDLNREAFDALNTKKHLMIIPGATHLFEEPGKLEQVAAAATGWYEKYL